MILNFAKLSWVVDASETILFISFADYQKKKKLNATPFLTVTKISIKPILNITNYLCPSHSFHPPPHSSGLQSFL